MSYRRVNYYELCRLCTSSEGNKLNIFREEGRRRQLQNKIQACLPVQIVEEDSLPKVVCHVCVKKLEHILAFRDAVVQAETMLESYFTSLRYSEDFLKEGKVYVKEAEKELEPRETPSPEAEPAVVIIEPDDQEDDDDPLKNVDKMQNNQIIDSRNQQQLPVLVSNMNASNIQIISGVQSRVQQYKCAMQMQGGGVAAAVVEATAETHYSYQQQTAQQVSPQHNNQSQNQMADQQSQLQQIHHQNQLQQGGNHQNQMGHQQQGLRQMSQQQTMPSQTSSQQMAVSNASQLAQQIQQLQRQHRHLHHQHMEKQQQEHQVQSLQNNNIVLKSESDSESSHHPVIQKVSGDSHKNLGSPPTYTTMQAPEVFLSLGFKDSSLSRDDSKDVKSFIKSDEVISRNAIGPISEFLKMRSAAAPEGSSLISVTPQTMQTIKGGVAICRECGKSFSSMNQLHHHNCDAVIISPMDDLQVKDEPLQVVNGTTVTATTTAAATTTTQFSCDVCGKPFKRKEHFLQHRRLHSGERPYVCTTCSKAFSRKEHLIRHGSSHTGQKMHGCEMCGKSFSRKDNLQKHLKTHGMSGPFICETCGKSFVIKHYYLIHVASHSAAAVSAAGGSGQVVAAGENNARGDPLATFKCDICQRTFNTHKLLMSHKLRHRSKNSGAMQDAAVASQQQTSELGNMTNAEDNLGNNQNGGGPPIGDIHHQDVVERGGGGEQQEGFPGSQYQQQGGGASGGMSQFQ